uniref:Uncharacterized protein n=1 Tax=Roseihalotalea indica TaxID=2867963 RepID=A0AA49GQJ1_9BACT|nr:hypothetical protein K4G66_07970 [Tunicatimonas sp. TK19036]
MPFKTALMTIISGLQLMPVILYGQQNEMFIEQIAGRKIVRENFDQNGQRQGKQVFSIGELMQEDNTYEVDVIAELYDENEQLEDKYTTTYQCNPDELDILINVFPFADPNEEKIKVDITSEDFRQLYDLQSGEQLKDIHLKMSVESGVLSFFGSKSRVTIKNRRKKSVDEQVKISSDAVINAYLMGIKIKTINYSIEEYLTRNFVLQRQKFTEDDASHFIMNYDDIKL